MAAFFCVKEDIFLEKSQCFGVICPYKGSQKRLASSKYRILRSTLERNSYSFGIKVDNR